MPRTLKVYAWTGFRPTETRGHVRQTDEVVAARSVAEVLRITGMSRSEWNHQSGTETGNEHEIAAAMTEPGVVFWTDLNTSTRGDAIWRRAEPRNVEGDH